MESKTVDARRSGYQPTRKRMSDHLLPSYDLAKNAIALCTAQNAHATRSLCPLRLLGIPHGTLGHDPVGPLGKYDYRGGGRVLSTSFIALWF